MAENSPNTGADFEELDLNEVDLKYPNSLRFLTGSLFICHAGADFRRILDKIVHPVVYDRFADGYFLHNRLSGGSEGYKKLVTAALHLCDKFLVVISQHAVGHSWVYAEVDWLVQHERPIILCRLDDTSPNEIHAGLTLESGDRATWIIDFRGEFQHSRTRLAKILDQLLARMPYPRLEAGSLKETPGR